MAAKRSKTQLAEVARFVDWLYEQGGFATWAEFASAAGVHWASLSDWHTGKKMPDGWNLYRLIKAAGGHGVEETRAIEHVAEEGSIPRRLEELEERTTDGLAGLRVSIESLTSQLDKLSRRLPREAAPSRSKR